jgi:hypothetical protein
MADKIKAERPEDKPFAIHPAGQFAAVCGDIIDLGKKWEQFPGKPGKATHKLVILFRTGEVNPDTGKPFEMRQEFTASMFDKGNLRPFIEAWLGRAFESDDAAWDALDKLDKLEGRSAFLSIVHEKAKTSDRVFAKINAVMPLPKGMAKPELPAYTRDEWWAKQRAAYAEELAKHAPAAPVKVDSYEDFEHAPEALDNDADLPF